MVLQGNSTTGNPPNPPEAEQGAFGKSLPGLSQPHKKIIDVGTSTRSGQRCAHVPASTLASNIQAVQGSCRLSPHRLPHRTDSMSWSVHPGSQRGTSVAPEEELHRPFAAAVGPFVKFTECVG